ncbi:MAG: D-alanyl-D-alanine carboxypeptidase [Clostridia bacterium]|nr:D-alanyl-D-alanine carboxypeptidase [Clostridia bacterium]
MKNPKERIVILALFLILIFVFYATVIFSATDFSLSAKAAVLYEPVTDNFLYTKNANVRLPMASTTKIMTALVALEESDLNEEIRVADEAIGIEGSSLYLKRGEILSMKELLYGLMLRSANDAAAAIAYAVSGGIDEFADKMNEKARSLGLTDTHFTNPHGLDDEEHYTTARELALISAAALKNQTFKEIVSSKKTTITNKDGEARLVVNHNKLLNLYDGAIGVKTGFTKRCGRCLVGAAEKDGLTFITVTINAPDDWRDHMTLFDYGYSLLEMRHLARVGEFRYDIPVLDSISEFVTVKNTESLDIIMQKEAGEVKANVKLSRYLAAPINENDILGKVIFTIDGKYLGEVDLVAETGAKSSKNKGLFSIFK